MSKVMRRSRGKTARRDPGAKTRRQKMMERRATAAERRRQAVAALYGLLGDDDTEGYRRPRPPKGA